jgi:hypothetical protein
MAASNDNSVPIPTLKELEELEKLALKDACSTETCHTLFIKLANAGIKNDDIIHYIEQMQKTNTKNPVIFKLSFQFSDFLTEQDDKITAYIDACANYQAILEQSAAKLLGVSGINLDQCFQRVIETSEIPKKIYNGELDQVKRAKFIDLCRDFKQMNALQETIRKITNDPRAPSYTRQNEIKNKIDTFIKDKTNTVKSKAFRIFEIIVRKIMAPINHSFSLFARSRALNELSYDSNHTPKSTARNFKT